MLKAYFDESGIHGSSKWIGIYGFIARQDVWIEIEREWREHLATARVPFFHASEFEAGEEPYFGMNAGVRQSLPIGLANVICKHRPHVVESVIEVASWIPELEEHGWAPYRVCFDHCIQQVASWSDDAAFGEPVMLIFSQQTQYAQLALETFTLYEGDDKYRSRLAGLRYQSMRNSPPLQAADFIAYEMYRHLSSGGHENPDPDLRKAFEILVGGGIPVYSTPYDPAEASQLLRKQPVAR